MVPGATVPVAGAQAAKAGEQPDEAKTATLQDLSGWQGRQQPQLVAQLPLVTLPETQPLHVTCPVIGILPLPVGRVGVTCFQQGDWVARLSDLPFCQCHRHSVWAVGMRACTMEQAMPSCVDGLDARKSARLPFGQLGSKGKDTKRIVTETRI